jgi:PAS domain S-box-containing protein
MKPSLKWSHAILVFALMPLIFELSFIGLMFGILREIDTSKQLRSRDLKAALESGKFMDALVDSGAGALMAKLGFRGATHRQFKKGTQYVDRAERSLVNYLMNDPEQTRFALELNSLYKEFGEYMRLAGRTHVSGNMIASLQFRMRAMGTLQQLLNISREFQELHLSKAFKREENERAIKNLMQMAIFIFFLISVAIAGGLAMFLNKSIVRKLDALSDNAQKLATCETLNPPLSGNDEFAELDRSFHAMSEAVTEALRQERQVVENATDLICVLNADGVFTSVNPACQRLLELQPQEVVGKNFLQFVVPQFIDTSRSSFEKAKSSAEPITFESALKSKTRTVETLWTSSWSEPDHSLFCVVHDISARKEAERLRLDLTAMLSHDLRTPITSIQVALDMLSDGVFGQMPAGLSRKVNHAARQSMQAMYLINDLLDVEKLESSEIPLYVVATDINELLEGAMRDLLPIAAERGIKVNMQLQGLKVFVDKEQFTRVLRNLLNNSIAQAPADSIIEISAQAQDEHCVISIKDSGATVKESEIATLFDRFHDSAQGLPKRLENCGLSLAVCGALVNAHKGELTARTTEDCKFEYVVKIAASKRRSA